MLEDTRRRGATVIMYIIFGALIAGFVISFGPQSVGSNEGCKGPASQTVLTMGDKDYGMPTWRWAFNTLQGGSYAGRVVQGLDALTRRELLAQEADARGLQIDDSIIDEKIKRGEIYVLTEKLDGKRVYFEDGEYFNYKMLERWIGMYGMTIAGFKAEQRRELMAVAMMDILASGAHVSRDEAFALWLHSHNDVTLDVVSFSAETYRAKMVIEDADVARYLTAHADEVKAKYEADKALAYTGTTPRVKVRRVFVARQPEPVPPEPEPAPEPAPTTADGGVEPAPAPKRPPAEPVVLKPDPALAKLEAARAEIVGKKKTFVEVARALDADEGLRNKGGEIGWLLPESPGLGAPELTEALKALTPGGEPSKVIETPEGFWLLMIEERREGDLTFDQVKTEIAASLAADHYAKEAARRAALETLADARGGKGKNLADMFEKAPEQAPPVSPELSPEDREQRRKMMEEQRKKLEQEMNDPSKSPEEREQIRQILELIDSGQLGSVWEHESASIPAAWAAQADAPAAAEPQVPPEPPAATSAADLMKPSTEPLPKFAAVDKPKVARIGPIPRDRDTLQDLGKAPDLIKAVFDELGDNALADRIFEVETRTGTAYVVVQVITKTVPDPAKFDEQSASFIDSMREERGNDIVTEWLKARCTLMRDKGKIKVGRDLLVTRDEKGTTVSIPYEPCSAL